MNTDIDTKPLTLKDKWQLLPAFLMTRGLVRQHLDSYNHFIHVELKEILKANEYIYCEADPNWFVQYIDIRVGMPDIEESFGMSRKTTPHECRLRDITYSAPILVDIEYARGSQRIVKHNLTIGRMPIMLKSRNCSLNGKSFAELVKVQECPIDSGGYFVVNGSEKVILIHEQLAKNRMLIEEGPVCQVTSASLERKSRTNIVINKKGQISMKHNAFTEDIPIFILLRAMGLTSDVQIVDLICNDSTRSVDQDLLLPSLEVSHAADIWTDEQALKYLVGKLKMSINFVPSKLSNQYDHRRKSQLDHVRELLNTTVVAHIPVVDGNYRIKAIYICQMVRRLIKAINNPEYIDDRDYYGNKRLELAGSLLSLLFEDLLKRFNNELRIIADKNIPKIKTAQFDVVKHMRQDIITNGLTSAIATGNWTVKRFRMERVGVSQVLSRLSFISALGMMTRINSAFEKTRKTSGPRSLQNSQWGLVCPCDTPEGEACGLIKNLALMTHITTNVCPEDKQKLIRYCFDIAGVENIDYVSVGLYMNSNYLVYVDGIIIGITYNPTRVVTTIRALRRRRTVSEFVSVSYSTLHMAVYVATDGGRLCRPYIVLGPVGKPLMTDDHLKDLYRGFKNFQDMIDLGLIEYLDVNESSISHFALTEADITPISTHLEIEPFTLLGVCAGLIPFPHNNQSPRNTYQCAMGKQAMGTIGFNQRVRIDTLLYSLAYPQRPVVSSKTIDLIHFDELPAGINSVVAVMSYSGFDIEDAIVMNKSSIDRAFGRCFVYRSQKCLLKKSASSGKDDIQPPPLKPDNPNVAHRVACLDIDGIVAPGERMKDRQILVNRYSPTTNPLYANDTSGATVIGSTNYRENALTYRGIEPVVVERVIITSNLEESFLIKINLRQHRRPEVGDKFSSRHGQKGVIGLIANQEDMPFNSEGVCPDLIMNPHGFPSRMTVGKLKELMAGKSAVVKGTIHDSTVFGGTSLEEMESILIESGFHLKSKEIMTSGTSGELLKAYIYFGPIYYQKLKHMVLDKIHGRPRGPRAVLTRQPTEGRAREGGLRLGEMERDCLIGHGVSMLLIERLMLSSDAYHADVCTKCGLFGYLNWCSSCRSSQNVASIQIPYAYKLLIQELQSMNIDARLKLGKMRD